MSNDFLVVSTDSHILQALDASDGAVQWERTTGHRYGGSALARTDTRVIAASLDGHLCALHQDDGTVRWETMVPDLPELPQAAGCAWPPPQRILQSSMAGRLW